MLKFINPAQIFLEDYLELRVLEKYTEEWNIDKLENNPPRYFRLKRILSCLKAMGIKYNSWKDFEKGYFYSDQNVKFEAEKISDMMNQLIKDKNIKFPFSGDYYELDYAYYFYMALSIRRSIYQFNTLQNNVLTVSDNYTLPLLVIDEILMDLTKYTSTLDELIINLLNPMKVSFSKNEMIEKFEFPDINLEEVDLDWI